MDLRALRYFITVLEAGSLSRAAHSLYVAQPALTAQIKKLEAELGTQLLERSHAGVTPTPAGNQLYEDARRLLSDADAMCERLQRLPQGPEGSVTIAMPFLLTSLLMGPVIAGLRETHPRIHVFVLDDLSLMVQKAMLDRRADLGILVDTPSLQELQLAPLASEAIFFCGRDASGSVAPVLQPSQAAAGTAAASSYPCIDFADAAAQPLVLQSRRFAIRQAVENAAAQRQARLNIVHEHDSARVIRSLYHCGAGFTFTPACSLAEALPWRPQAPRAATDPQWIVAQVVNPSLQRHYHLAQHPGKAGDAAVQVVRHAVVQHARSLIDSGIWQARWLHEARP